jgi:hypothetical protein
MKICPKKIKLYEVNKKGGRGRDIIKLITSSSFTIVLNYFLCFQSEA